MIPHCLNNRPCNAYCVGTTHAVLILAPSDITVEDLSVYATALGCVFLHARPAPETDKTDVQRNMIHSFDRATRTFFPYVASNTPEREIVWLLWLDTTGSRESVQAIPAEHSAERRVSRIRNMLARFLRR